jgi:hypothetical protein
MKIGVSILLIFFIHFSTAQKRLISYSSIDWDVANIEASTPEELAQKLTVHYKTDLEKTRANFSWIAHNISYNYLPNKLRGKNGKSSATTLVNYDIDTSSTLKPLNQLVAEDVIKKRSAFCYGYARLFKCLCDYAYIPCEIINGYARGDLNKIGNNFHTNHTWNAVRLDSNWYLVDVTWASGYFTYGNNEFIKHFDDQYFLTPPAEFARDHFPDNLEWSLLQLPPTLSEFQHSPYKSRCFIKYNITSYWPSGGVIQAAVGDTINLHVQTDLALDRNIGGGSLDDSSIRAPLPAAIYCKPVFIANNHTINYKYIVQSSDAQWLQLVYNDDMILRYKLNITDKKERK